MKHKQQNREDIIESLENWKEVYKERWEMCKKDLVNAYTETDQQVIKAQMQIYDDNIAELKYIIKEAKGEEI